MAHPPPPRKQNALANRKKKRILKHTIAPELLYHTIRHLMRSRDRNLQPRLRQQPTEPDEQRRLRVRDLVPDWGWIAAGGEGGGVVATGC